MAGKIVNRRPFSVNVNSAEIEQQFFNHVNWKGLCTDKNYFNLDQETFEDCKNVYIDSEGLLKSRPAFKAGGYDFDVVIKECRTFPNGIKVYIYDKGLYIHQGDDVQSLYGFNKCHLLYEEKLFIFTDIVGKYVLYYDEETRRIVNLDVTNLGEHLYIPIKTLITDGVRTDVDTKNVLTDYYRERYNYVNTRKIINPSFRNKDVTIVLDDKSYDVNFGPHVEDVIFVPKSYYDNSDNKFLQISSDDSVMLISSVKTIFDTNNLQEINTWTMEYSLDGKIYNEIPNPDFNIYGRPILSKDGSIVVVFGNDGPYAYSLFADNNAAKTFDTWTNLLTYNGISPSTIPSIGQVASKIPYPDNNTFKCIGGTFLSPDTFVFSYGTSPFVDLNKNMYYPHMQHVIVKQGVFHSYDFGFATDEPEYEANKWLYAIDNAEINTFLKYNPVTADYYGASAYIISMGDTNSTVGRESLEYSIYNDEQTIHYGRVSDPKDQSVEYVPLGIYDFSISADNQIQILLKDTSYKLVYMRLKNYFTVLNYIKLNDENILDASLAQNFNILTNEGYYITSNIYGKYSKLNFIGVTAGNSVQSSFFNYIVSDGVIYSSDISNYPVYIDVWHNVGDKLKKFVPSHSTKSNAWYLSIDNELYVSNNKTEYGKNKLYIPEISRQSFDYHITNLHQVSENQVAIFFENEIWYTNLTEHGYEYYKSKLNVGLREGSDVINSIDGKNIIFSSTEGLVYLSYEELVQSTEQTLTYLSDLIYELYKEYNKDFVKLYLNKYWLYCYNTKSTEFFIFDIRNNSWWKWEYNYPILNILVIDGELQLFANTIDGSAPIIKLSYSIDDYYDYDDYAEYGSSETKIDWYFTSQKLHLSTLNYYKNISSIIINNVEPENSYENVSYNLSIKNYRITISNRYEDVKTMEYEVNMLRTYVKRCNSRKVNQFQYTVSNDKDNVIQLPLSIHSIIVKYSIGGQVR